MQSNHAIVTIGAEELIYWMRKNDDQLNITNDVLGKELRQIIEESGGSIRNNGKEEPARWGVNASHLGPNDLPKTAAQYEINVAALGDVFVKIHEQYKLKGAV